MENTTDDSEDLRVAQDLRSFAGGCRLRVGILVWPMFTLNALSGFVDALRLASDLGDRGGQVLCSWEIMAVDRALVTASCGVRIAPTAPLLDPKSFDYIVVVAGRTTAIADGAAAAFQYVQQAASLGVPIIALCTGSFVLAEAGLLDGRRACVANYHYREFTERYPKVRAIFDQLYCADGNRITCAGGGAAIDLAAHLVEKHCGRDRAIKISQLMIVDYLRQSNKAQRMLLIDYDRILDARIVRAVSLMEQHVGKPVPIPAICQCLNISVRQLERAFRREIGMSPMRFFRRLRVLCGYWKLLHTTASISAVAFDCGFSDHSHFTRCLVDEFGLTPSQLRRRNASNGPNLPPPIAIPDPGAKPRARSPAAVYQPTA